MPIPTARPVERQATGATDSSLTEIQGLPTDAAFATGHIVIVLTRHGYLLPMWMIAKAPTKITKASRTEIVGILSHDASSGMFSQIAGIGTGQNHNEYRLALPKVMLASRIGQSFPAKPWQRGTHEIEEI